MYVNFIFEIDKKLDYRKVFIFFEVAHSNHAKFIEMTHYLSHFVFRFRHFAVLMISEETRENCEKIVTYLSFHR